MIPGDHTGIEIGYIIFVPHVGLSAVDRAPLSWSSCGTDFLCLIPANRKYIFTTHSTPHAYAAKTASEIRMPAIEKEGSNDVGVFYNIELQNRHKFELSEDSISLSLLQPVSILLET
jgi:hypothetical protein